MKTFSEMGLPESLRHTLTHLNFVAPTPIQAKAIPIALKGNDILGSAQTGTGKTVAFAIPLIVNLYNKQNNTALVMTPTRELASQVMSQFVSLLGKKTKIRSALLIGGDSMFKQLNQLKNKPRLIVGTPAIASSPREIPPPILIMPLVAEAVTPISSISFETKVISIAAVLFRTRYKPDCDCD